MNNRTYAIALIIILLAGCSNNSATSDSTSPQPGADTDNDGLIDSDDPDDDNDGFLDSNDTSPLDASIPGNYLTPEDILSQPLIVNAIEQASLQGFSIDALTGTTPPNIAGYYREEEQSTVFVASDNGENIGDTRSGAEFRYDQLADNSINGAVVNFSQTNPTSYSISFNALLRGSGNQFTRYSRSLVTCTANNSNYSVLFVGISSAEVDSVTKDFVNRDRISISVGTAGTPTETCDRSFAGGAEEVGGWSASQASRIFRAEPNTFEFMCVDNDKAYAPTENWTSSDGSDCMCNTDYTTTCQ